MHYFSAGQIPPKRHTQFRKPDGNLYTMKSFFLLKVFMISTLFLYHINHPTRIIQVGAPIDVAPQKAETEDLKPRSLYGFRSSTGG
jgi:homogentisate 1,2-dioxygenase